jgi:hypothetical protein
MINGLAAESFETCICGSFEALRGRTPTFIAIDCSASRPTCARRKRPGSPRRVSAGAAPHCLVAVEPLLPIRGWRCNAPSPLGRRAKSPS